MKITIEIEGDCAEGKTTITKLLAHALREAGFGVNINDVDISVPEPAPTLEEQWLQMQRVAALVSKDLLIDIETVQTRKGKR